MHGTLLHSTHSPQPSLLFSLTCSFNMRRHLSRHFYHFFRPCRLDTKKDHLEVFFKFFSNYLNMKRLLTMPITWARNKILRREYGVFFKFFLDSLISKRSLTVTFFGLENKSTEKDHRAYLYFSSALVKTWKGGKKGGKRSFIWQSSIVSPLKMAYVYNYVLQFGYPFPKSHYHLYESSYSTDWLLFWSSMVSVFIIITLYSWFWSSQCFQFKSFFMPICSRYVSLHHPSAFLLTFWVGHPIVVNLFYLFTLSTNVSFMLIYDGCINYLLQYISSSWHHPIKQEVDLETNH